jgi:uncharacterized protein YecE (DUF72 family)
MSTLPTEDEGSGGQRTLRFGTCSWKYPSWAGLVYSSAEANFLAEYAERYPTVEIDQWFWSLFDTDSIGLPQISTVAEYLSAVPDDFQFTIKAPNSITLTHFCKKGNQRGTGENPYFLSPKLFADFLDRISAMRSQTALIMLQFEYLNRQKMGGADEFLRRLETFLEEVGAEWPLGVEIRNPNFLKSPYFETHDVTPVFCEGYFLPPVVSVYEEHKERLSGTGMLRLLGPDRQGIEKATGKKWNRIVAAKDEGLPAIADMIVDMIARGLDVIVNVNNHYEGSAPLSIERLERLVDERRERFSQIR